ncbi:site-specific integrase [Salmonella enterica]|uniref:Site-specific integrase n=2 Tax=Salmonella enterica TaxID=28901 RepID=A0A403T1U3_SALER|nr:site-specific integrase [Salmonella sp. SG203]EAB7739676.1 site-specific integrase [Salmonella enterica subsp. enterica serovar Hadar]EAV6572666.1 site-specific integrase [Salmonella enterica]EBQ9005048.1 site-specific integrase [Salmonella enterica subsp. enterica serovar Blockley]EBR8259070.1 site-specific integrase [Salmonella enterica subsp. enterica serovar Cerro]EBW7251878.1 site-specific integrase [Salmonella enterica subsp. enterica serovar Gatow]EBX7468976.1 site-specific integras
MLPSSRVKKLSLSRALDRYLDTVSVHKRGYRQEFWRVSVIKRHPVAQKMMDEVTTVDIAAYRDDRLAQVNPRTGKPISGDTVRLEMALLSVLYNLAKVEWGTCRANPVESVRRPKSSPGRDRRLTSSEERRLSRYFQVRNAELYTIFHLALETGMRQGEILSLRWEHIDLQHGVAHLPVTKNGSVRDVPLSRRARQLLQQLPVQLSGPVFHYKSSGFKSAWRAALQSLKIESLHFHDLRHEAISRLFELGTLNVMEVAAISGHKSLNMLKRYTHLRAYQLVSKLDVRRRQSQKIATYFVPYPGEMEDTDEGFRVHLYDFEGLSVSGHTREAAMDAASVVLLRRLASAAQHGERVPRPGDLPLQAGVMINPLAGAAPVFV